MEGGCIGKWGQANLREVDLGGLRQCNASLHPLPGGQQSVFFIFKVGDRRGGNPRPLGEMRGGGTSGKGFKKKPPVSAIISLIFGTPNLPPS